MSLDEYPHLRPHARVIAAREPEERIRSLRVPVWIGYTQAQSILAQLDYLLEYPAMHRMPNLLIVGRTNNGKTMLIDRFLELRNGAAIVSVQTPPKPEEKGFYQEIVRAVTAGKSAVARTADSRFDVVGLLRAAGTKMLILDEIHHILAGHIHLQSVFLNAIKYLSNQLRIPIVGVGTKDALRAIQTDPQMVSRFEPMAVPKWKLDDEFRRLLVSFESVLPLRQPSGLAMGHMPLRLLSMCEGQIGELRAILVLAATAAIRTGKEAIDHAIVEDLPWVLPSRRRIDAEQLA
ncbi:MAG: TniB family NTP-binding protein [Acidobacteriota bacterium]|nr:TniB family NTP-binding protein [Acidobacteriota bacterium]